MRTRRVAKVVGLVVALLALALVVYLAPAAPVIARYAAWPSSPREPLTVLVAGVSPRYSGYRTRAPENFDGLTDTMLLVQLNPAQGAIEQLSLPRDTRVRLPGYGNAKLNSALPRLGPAGLAQEAQDLTGLAPRGYVLVSLQAARDLVDALGGIEVDVPKAMRYSDTAAKLNIDLKPGRQVLDGEQAEGFLRFRKDNLGDIGRVARQQLFLRALLARLRSPAGILRLPAVLVALDRNTRTDLGRREVGALLGFMLGGPRLDSFVLPGEARYVGGVSYWIPDRDAAERIARAHFRGPAPAPRAPGELSVAVVNVGGARGAAGRARDRLRAAGYRNVWIAGGEGNPNRTTVVTDANLEEARRVSDALGFGEPQVGTGVPGADVTIRVAKDEPARGG